MKREAAEVVKRILLIDEKWDSPLFISLQQEGYEVIACDSAQKAWGLVFPFRPYVIIVHLHQPSRRDVAILQECRALAEGVPIIVATSVPGHEAAMQALEEGATSFLSLPAKPETIRRVLDELRPASGEK